ncbi:MAG: transglutaminase domain-containing protein [Gammaproteobacteria bacterium]|nr:transglutaminase domain-containing protein [Gammaproteobacteria bacterium]
MNVLPGLLGAALLVWGWHNELLAVAAGLAVLMELARWVPWRWDLSDKDFHRIADLSTLGFVAVAIYQFDAQGAGGIYGILRWLPVVLFAITAAQLFSTREQVHYTALFLSVRRAVARGTAPDPGGVDMRVPYLVCCLVSAAGGEAHPKLLLPSLAAIVVLALWANRPRRHGMAVWVSVLVACLALGWVAKSGFIKSRRILEPLVMAYLQERIASRMDPYRAYTAIGQIGKLKLSDRIVLRVRSEGGGRVPRLLRESTYETFARNMWVSRRSEFQELDSIAEGTAWIIHELTPLARAVTVSAYLPNGKGVIAVPGGTERIERLPVDGLYRNRLGALKVLRGPELIEYRTRYVEDRFVEAPPAATDLAVPVEYRNLLARLVDELGVEELADERRVLERVRSFFTEGFSYTLSLTRPSDAPTPLEDFLVSSRRGHCEFFATATVLMLRAAGIPARYATGYSVHEWSELEKSYVARRRHAHSWAIAYVDGYWRDVDTTPVGWAALEAAGSSWWEPVYDLASWLMFRFTRWRWSEEGSDSTAWLLWLIVPLALLLAWRLRMRQRIERAAAAAPDDAAEPASQGADSAFYDIERRLVEGGHPRRPGEPLGPWLGRLARADALPDAGLLVDEILPLHYRYRFAPGGLEDDERAALAARVREWLGRREARESQ